MAANVDQRFVFAFWGKLSFVNIRIMGTEARGFRGGGGSRG